MTLMRVKEYNSKVDVNGKYLPFYGWSTISFVDDGHVSNLNMVEAYLTEDPRMAKYFAAVPRDSYHVTIHNIWANGGTLLPHQKKFLDSRYEGEERSKLIRKSSKKMYFNPDFCMNELLKKIDDGLPELTKPTELVIGNLYFTGHTLGISFSEASDTSNFDLCRVACNKAVEKTEHVIYHMTLAYNYKDVEMNEVSSILEELNKKLCGIRLLMKVPFVSYFSDMTKFISYKYLLGVRCNKPIQMWD